MALVFYAGHGIQTGGRNYLVPSDAEIEVEEENVALEEPALEGLGSEEPASGEGVEIEVESVVAESNPTTAELVEVSSGEPTEEGDVDGEHLCAREHCEARRHRHETAPPRQLCCSDE